MEPRGQIGQRLAITKVDALPLLEMLLAGQRPGGNSGVLPPSSAPL
ncbi:MAG: hypothetical protein U0271_30780 [Polyangiaceae bacterium]